MDPRFRIIFEQTSYVRIQIILDMETGVRYLKSDGGIAPLLDSNSRPIIENSYY